MHNAFLTLAIVTLLSLIGASRAEGPDAGKPPSPQSAQPNPPVAPQVPYVVKSPNGDRTDEYYWLRDDDPKTKRPEVLRYLEAENAYTAAFMAPLQKLQDDLVAEMRARIREDDSTVPVYDGGWWLWRRFDKGAEYPVHLRQRGNPERPDPKAQPQVLLDEAAMAADQAFFNIGDLATSPNGQLLAWTEDTLGRRIYTLRFKDLRTGRSATDAIPGVLEQVVWAADNRSVFYILQDPVTLQSGAVMRHVLGTPVSADVKVFEEADKTLSTNLSHTASRRYVQIAIEGYDTAEIRVVDAARPSSPVRTVLQRRPGVRVYGNHLNGRWVFRTNEGAENFKLVSAPQATPERRETWRTLVPGRPDATLEEFALFNGGVAVQERVQADSRVRWLGAAGAVPIDTPAATRAALEANPDPAAAHLRYSVMSMVQPRVVMDLHLASGQRLLRKTQEVPGYEPARYATERFWAPSRDGLRIPVTLAWRTDRAQRNAAAPLLVMGYGAYGIPMDAYFSSNRVSLMDRGFVLATAHVRGGADLGQAWYEAGRMFNKKNSFNDFVDATDALVKAGWGAADRVFAVGGSAGGLLMGAVANQAGSRYRGIASHVPFVDVVTTMLDETIPLTANEWTQWGDPREKAAYDYMLSYSPYDNLRAQPYPAMLVTTGLWDSQVQYYEPAKYVARLRARKTDTQPLLLNVNMTAGHGGASGRFEALTEAAREYAFYLHLLASQPAPAAPSR